MDKKNIRIVPIGYIGPKLGKSGLNAQCKQHLDIFEVSRQIWMAKGQQKNCPLMKRTGWKEKTQLGKLHAMFFSLFRVDRPGSGEREDILESKIALKNNEGMLKTFETDCIVPGKKLTRSAFGDCEKKGKRSLLAKNHGACSNNYLSAQCKRSVTFVLKWSGSE